MTNMTISPVQTQGITTQDVALTAGAAAVGALSGGTMYFKTPSEDAFVKSGLKIENKALAAEAETLTSALKEANEIDAAKAAAQKAVTEAAEGEAKTAAQKAVTEAAEGEAKTAAQKALEEANAKKLSKKTQEALTKLGLGEGKQSATDIATELTNKVKSISDEKIFTKAKAAANEVLGEGAKLADDVKAAAEDTLKGKVKGLFNDAKENIKKEADTLKGEAKKGVEILKKAKMSAALKWGGIAAGALALLTAGYLYCTKGNNAQAEQAQPENV